MSGLIKNGSVVIDGVNIYRTKNASQRFFVCYIYVLYLNTLLKDLFFEMVPAFGAIYTVDVTIFIIRAQWGKDLIESSIFN